MQIIGSALLIAYLAAMIFISVRDSKAAKNFTEYAVAGKSQTTRAVVLTLLATIFGASATIGIVDTTYTTGFPAIWWLWFGALGLLLQALFISKKVRDLDADTLPHAAGMLVGPVARRVIALVIAVSWIGVIAGQFVALGSIVSYLTGAQSQAVLVAVCVLAIAYTALGGQTSVVRTDKLQFYILAAGLIVACVFLYFAAGGNSTQPLQHFELLNEKYTPTTLITQLFVVGGVFFLGPDIMSRNLISKDAPTARRAAAIAGVCMAVLALVIVLIGLWAKYNVEAGAAGSTKMLVYLMNEVMPAPVGLVLALALLSAILSSTDTCLINASSIFVKDLLLPVISHKAAGAEAIAETPRQHTRSESTTTNAPRQHARSEHPQGANEVEGFTRRSDAPADHTPTTPETREVFLVRATVVVIGALAAIFAFSGTGDIITILSNAYSVYTPGVIFPLTLAILCHGKREIRSGAWIAAVAVGGVFGLVGAYAPTYAPGVISALPQAISANLTLIGMGASLLLALASIKWRKHS